MVFVFSRNLLVLDLTFSPVIFSLCSLCSLCSLVTFYLAEFLRSTHSNSIVIPAHAGIQGYC